MGRYPKESQKSNDSSSNSLNENVSFNKKKYREAKYNNQHKVNKWVSKRKNEFLREMKNDTHVSKKFIKSIARDTCGHQKLIKSHEKKQKNVLDEKAAKKEEIKRKIHEKEEALKKYKKKRTETFIKLSKKTKKGQPVMKDRIEMLLQKIQASTN